MKTQPLKIVTFVDIYTEISRQYLLSGTEQKGRRVLLHERRYYRISDKKTTGGESVKYQSGLREKYGETPAHDTPIYTTTTLLQAHYLAQN